MGKNWISAGRKPLAKTAKTNQDGVKEERQDIPAYAEASAGRLDYPVNHDPRFYAPSGRWPRKSVIRFLV